MKTLTKHYQLNTKQIHILKMTYKFRIMTAPLLAQYEELKSNCSTFTRLESLRLQGYLGRHQEDNDKFQNKGFRYYLTRQGLLYIGHDQNISKHSLRPKSKNKSVGSAFIDHAVDVFRAYLSLRRSYPGVFDIFTINELGEYDYFPNPKPDLYLNRVKYQKGTNEFMLYLEHANPSFVTKKRFDKLLEHFDSGEWETELGTPYPAILFVLSDSGSERRIQRYITDKLYGAGIDDLQIMTTSIKALALSKEPKIWSGIQDTDRLVDLTDIPVSA